jgi:hypothetical protein
MPAELSKNSADKIKKAKSLLEALRIIANEPLSFGTLKIQQDGKEGQLVFRSGLIIDAFFASDSSKGEESLTTFVSFKNPKFLYLPSEPADPLNASTLNLPIGEYIAQITPVAFEQVSDKRIPVKLLLYMTWIGTLAFLVYIIPASIRSAAIDPSVELNARNRLRNLIQSELSKDSPQETAEMTPSRTANVKVIAEGKAAVPEDLRFARYLTDKGKIDSAIPYYEKVLGHDPNNISVRLELINAYIATKKPHSARVLCIRTFKKKLTPEQVGAVWQLFKQVQTD